MSRKIIEEFFRYDLVLYRLKTIDLWGLDLLHVSTSVIFILSFMYRKNVICLNVILLNSYDLALNMSLNIQV